MKTDFSKETSSLAVAENPDTTERKAGEITISNRRALSSEQRANFARRCVKSDVCGAAPHE
jgi:hypothetical protein